MSTLATCVSSNGDADEESCPFPATLTNALGSRLDTWMHQSDFYKVGILLFVGVAQECGRCGSDEWEISTRT